MAQTCVNPSLFNNVKERLLLLSPTVKAGLERECTRGDFYREGAKAIGQGGFGEVWKVRHKYTNETYAIKVIDKRKIKKQNMVAQTNREIEIMYKLHHPHIMQLVNHFEDDDNFYMIMPFASKGQLFNLLMKQRRFDQRTAAQYMRETIAAVKYLHEHSIIHRDIKPENLLLDENFRVKLSDFGWSNFKMQEGDTRKTYCGTPEYLSPEMIRKQPHNYSIDIWSLGVLLFEFLAGYSPFGGYDQNVLFSNIKKLKINWPEDFPPLAKNLVTKILKINPDERPSLDEISSHIWFQKNPAFRPVLCNTLTDPKEILNSHLVDGNSNKKNVQKRDLHSNTGMNSHERNRLLKEIDEKSTMIKELEMQNKKLEEEREIISKEKEDNAKSIKELKDKEKEKDERIIQLEKEVEAYRKESESYKERYEKSLQKLNEFNSKILQTADDLNNNDNDVERFKRAVCLFSENVKDFKKEVIKEFSLFEKKFQSSSEELALLANSKMKKLQSGLEAVKEVFNRENAEFEKRISNHCEIKATEVTEWYKKQVNELLSYKKSALIQENKITKLESENYLLKNKLSISEKMKKLCEEKEQIKSSQISKLNEEIEILESNKRDIILFVIQNKKILPEQFFSEFKAQYKIKLKQNEK